MIIVYAPEGADAHRWDLKTVRVLSSEAEAVEKVTGLTWAQVKKNLSEGSMTAMRAVAWILAKRDDPTLRYRGFDPAEGELDVDFDRQERAALREAINTDDELTDAQRAVALQALEDTDPDEEPDPQPDAEADQGAGEEGPKGMCEDVPAPLPEAGLPTASPAVA